VVPSSQPDNLEESVGYVPGIISEITNLHAKYYSKSWIFDHFFEAKVATELSTFVSNYNPAKDRIWSLADRGQIRASITIDSSAEHGNIAHLRWFIVAEQYRGYGAGNRLMQNAINFSRDKGYAGIYLSTFRGLDPARHLYEKYGFAFVSEEARTQWASKVTEQRFEIRLT
jgi:ribosomal protein S18 acetylase RimI-like enzyme